MKCGSFSTSYPRTDSSNGISNVTGWNYRPSQKHNLLGQNIYTEADQNHLQQVHSRNWVETTHVKGSVDFLFVRKAAGSNICVNLFSSIMNFFAVLHCVILISVCEILGEHRTNGKWKITHFTMRRFSWQLFQKFRCQCSIILTHIVILHL